MCGIAGVIGYDEAALRTMLTRIRHRGPDHFGTMALPNRRGYLGHVRLSILDLDQRSHQPFLSDCRRYALVFNGEIYNFQELRADLEALGHRFRTTSDTEVLLQWMIRYGTAGLAQLEGMFAFCLADRDEQTLLLVRDQIGEKPLYYSFTTLQGSPRFAFASEIKSLLTLGDVDTSLDRIGLLDYLRFLYTAPPHTLYQGIQELPPGHYFKMRLDDRTAPVLHEYYDVESRLGHPDSISFPEAAERFRRLFSQSVQRRLISDVRVGLFLSAGIDSNAILAAMKDVPLQYPLETFTLEYMGQADESRQAKQIAHGRGLTNETIPFTQLDFCTTLDRVVALFDQPFGNSTAIVSDMIAAKAAGSCKVCLVGDGGDELLIGYPRYHALTRFAAMQRWPSLVHRALLGLFMGLPETGATAVSVRRAKQFLCTLGKPMAEAFLDWSTYLDTPALSFASGIADARTDFYRQLLATFTRHQADPMRAAAIVDMKSFVPCNLLQSADRTSMAHSLELRTPFLSTILIHGILGLPSRIKVQKQKKALVTVPYAQDLTAAVVRQPKRPFNPPIRAMLRDNLPILKEYLLSSTARVNTVLEKRFVRQQVEAFETSRRDNSTFLWGLATLERWLQRAA